MSARNRFFCSSYYNKMLAITLYLLWMLAHEERNGVWRCVLFQNGWMNAMLSPGLGSPGISQCISISIIIIVELPFLVQQWMQCLLRVSPLFWIQRWMLFEMVREYMFHGAMGTRQVTFGDTVEKPFVECGDLSVFERAIYKMNYD